MQRCSDCGHIRYPMGDKLEAVFDAVTPEVTIPRFKLRAG